MTLSEFRMHMDEQWDELDRAGMAGKNSHDAVLRLMKLYERLKSDEQGLADQVLAEWVLSANIRKQFDALALVDQFRISTALPQLRVLETALQKRRDHEAPYELAKVTRILERLSS